MNSRVKGNIGIGEAIAHYTRLGIPVSIPITDTQPYDLVVDIDNQLHKVQVKYTSYKDKKNFQVGLRTIRCNTKELKIDKFKNLSIDILFCVTSSGDNYEIPASEIVAKTGITLSGKYDKWKVRHGHVKQS